MSSPNRTAPLQSGASSALLHVCLSWRPVRYMHEGIRRCSHCVTQAVSYSGAVRVHQHSDRVQGVSDMPLAGSPFPWRPLLPYASIGWSLLLLLLRVVSQSLLAIARDTEPSEDKSQTTTSCKQPAAPSGTTEAIGVNNIMQCALHLRC